LSDVVARLFSGTSQSATCETEIRHELVTQRSSFFVFMGMTLTHNDKITSVPESVCSSTCLTSKLLNEFELNFISGVHTKFGSCV
jgi:hypothetical protein